MPSKTPKHLWSGDWREEAETARVRRGAPDSTAIALPSVPAAATSTGKRRRSPRALIAGAAVTVLAAVAFVLGNVTGEDDAGRTGALLPAVASTPLTPPAGQTQAGAIYAAASPAVVSIRAGSGAGTGFLIDDEGTIVTNAHVVDGSDRVEIHFGEDGDAISGEVLGEDASSDLAVVKIPAARIPSGTDPLRLADSSQVGVGETVVAIGNPFGLDRTVTEGIVSAVGRDIRAPNGFQISEAIQTDAAINPGNSGGPLLDDGGTVIGVNSQIETAGAAGGNIGVGFAVPSNTVRQVVPVLQDGGTVQRAWLGVSTSDARGAGARVEETVGGSPAAAAGVRDGDVITAIDEDDVPDSSSLVGMVETLAPGEEITLHVDRGGRELEIELTLRTRPPEAP